MRFKNFILLVVFGFVLWCLGPLLWQMFLKSSDDAVYRAAGEIVDCEFIFPHSRYKVRLDSSGNISPYIYDWMSSPPREGERVDVSIWRCPLLDLGSVSKYLPVAYKSHPAR